MDNDTMENVKIVLSNIMDDMCKKQEEGLLERDDFMKEMGACAELIKQLNEHHKLVIEESKLQQERELEESRLKDSKEKAKSDFWSKVVAESIRGACGIGCSALGSAITGSIYSKNFEKGLMFERDNSYTNQTLKGNLPKLKQN